MGDGKVSEYVRNTWNILSANFMPVTFISGTLPSVSNSKLLLLLIVETWPLYCPSQCSVTCISGSASCVTYIILGPVRSTKGDNQMNISFSLLLALATIT